MGKRLTVQELAVRREQAALIGAVESTIEAAKIANRERSGCLITQRGRIIRKRKFAGVYASAVKSTLHSVSTKLGSQVPGRALEVAVRDSIIRTMPALLVRVVKGPRHMTIGDVVTITVPDDAPATDVMAKLRAMVAGSTAR